MTANIECSNIGDQPLILSYEQLSHILYQTEQHNRKGFYFIYDYLVETKKKSENLNVHDIYLVGHHLLPEKARIFSGFEDEQLFSKLDSSSSLKQLVYGIGIYAYSNDTEQISVVFETKRIDSSYSTTITCQTDGTEAFVKLDDFNWTDEDEHLQKLSFESDTDNALASITIVFYLHEGFETTELSIDMPVNYDTLAYNNMIEKSLISSGNNLRLKNAIEKAKRGEEVTIAYIGGSITQGAVALPTHNCYAYQSYLQFKQLFGQNGGDHIHFIKAGVGGTPSELGMIRYERDILRGGKVHPDIIIVEFAVNDADDETKGICYESLVSRALHEPNSPAVILLFSVFFSDWNLQDRLVPIGQRYNLPMVSIKDAVVDQFYMNREEGQVITKRQFFYDIYHPTNAGHKIMADCLAKLFTEVDLQKAATDDISLETILPVYGTGFKCIKLIDRINIPASVQISRGSFDQIDNELQCVELDNHNHATPQFPYNWYHTSDSGDESFNMQLSCKKLLIVFKDSGDSSFGMVNVYINHKLVKQLDAHEVKWNHCHTVLLIDEQQSHTYHVEIKMAEGHEHKSFTILGFGYVA